MTAFVHHTIMRDEVVRLLAPKDGGLYVDATLGGGGHSEAILAAASCSVIGVDRDEVAIEAARARLAGFGDRLTIVKSAFGALFQAISPVIESIRRDHGQIDGIVADLGVSSPQLDDPTRGMSFRREASSAPLDMRMDRGAEETARGLIDRLSEEALADVIFEYGEERRSRKIARSIKRLAAEGKLETTGDLRHAVYAAIGGKSEHGIDPATRTFQAIRIAVNDELGELDRLLASLPTLVTNDGVAAVISFHSLEDGRVKRAFADAETWTALTRKPLAASEEEVARNPRARSAKLRAARRGAAKDDRMARYEARKARKFGGAR